QPRKKGSRQLLEHVGRRGFGQVEMRLGSQSSGRQLKREWITSRESKDSSDLILTETASSHELSRIILGKIVELYLAEEAVPSRRDEPGGIRWFAARDDCEDILWQSRHELLPQPGVHKPERFIRV